MIIQHRLYRWSAGQQYRDTNSTIRLALHGLQAADLLIAGDVSCWDSTTHSSGLSPKHVKIMRRLHRNPSVYVYTGRSSLAKVSSAPGTTFFVPSFSSLVAASQDASILSLSAIIIRFCHRC